MKYFEVRYVGKDKKVNKFILEAISINDANRQFKLLTNNAVLSVSEVNSVYGFVKELFQ